MDKRRGKAQKDNKLDEFVENFSAFAHPIDRFALSHWYFPIFSIYILAKIVGLPIWIQTGHIWLRIREDKFYLLFAFTLVLAVLAFNKWVIRIPHAMAAFMERDLISPKPEKNIDHPYLDFLNRYQQALHSRKRFFVIAPFLLFVVGIVILMANGNSDVASDIVPFAIISRDFSTIFYVFLFYMATGLVWAYFAGVAGWIIGVTGWYLWQLPIQFEIKIQPNHPDHCGGLFFLGNFCFRMVVPVLIGSVFMGVIGLGSEILQASDLQASEQLRLAANLTILLVALPLTYITFFTPMWSIHTAMIKKKTEFEGHRFLQLAKLDDKIQPLIQQEKFAEAGKVLDEINLIKSSSPERFPVWPFDTAILARFLTPQVVPVISFVFGIKNQDYLSIIMDYIVRLK